jgi:hypothetical protein
VTDSGFSYYHQTKPDEQLLYDHLQERAEHESPEETIARFRRLFLGEQEYEVVPVWKALGRIIDSDLGRERFIFTINRCCYILVNRWQKRPRLQWAIPELIGLLSQEPSGLPPSWTAHLLRRMMQQFIQTEQYQALRRLAHLFHDRRKPDKQEETQLEHLIVRYPYLYDHCFLTDESTTDQRQQIRQMRQTASRRFDRELYQYMSYQRSSPEQKLILPTPKNPTLLSDRKLTQAVSHFTGKVDRGYTYQESSRLFLKQAHRARSYRTFKEDLYEYLSSSIDSKYGKKRFNQRLYQTLQETLPHNDSQKVSDSLIAGTCRKVLNFIVVEGAHRPNHFVLLDLTSNLGITPVVGLMLKIVLVCRRVRGDLEKRFAVLFTHYAGFPKPKVLWLVESLENLNLAFSLNFGSKKTRLLSA